LIFGNARGSAASEKSSYATGASFVVDGGLTLMAAELSS
jgi:hypothetical protein